MSLIPYLILVAIYFMFINIEASKDKKSKKLNNITGMIQSESEKTIEDFVSIDDNKENLRISIPVIPYKE